MISDIAGHNPLTGLSVAITLASFWTKEKNGFVIKETSSGLSTIVH